MPTGLPTSRALSCPKLRRVMWLRARVAVLSARMGWLPATRAQRRAGARRWFTLNEEVFRLLDMPEPDDFVKLCEAFEGPPDGSTNPDPPDAAHPDRAAASAAEIGDSRRSS